MGVLLPWSRFPGVVGEVFLEISPLKKVQIKYCRELIGKCCGNETWHEHTPRGGTLPFLGTPDWEPVSLVEDSVFIFLSSCLLFSFLLFSLSSWLLDFRHLVFFSFGFSVLAFSSSVALNTTGVLFDRPLAGNNSCIVILCDSTQ